MASCCHPEDILLCIDVESEMDFLMTTKQQQINSSSANDGGSNKVNSNTGMTRMDAVRQALLLFVHSKSKMNSRHRFCLATLTDSAKKLSPSRNYSSDASSLSSEIRSLRTAGKFNSADLDSLIRLAQTDLISLSNQRESVFAVAGRSKQRQLRVILIYGRSTVIPSFPLSLSTTKQRQQHASAPLPELSSPSFSPSFPPSVLLDLVYLHERPSENNCPQSIFDSLVLLQDSVGGPNSFVFESSSGLSKALLKNFCSLLAHPSQRGNQEDVAKQKNLPKNLTANE